MAHHSGGEERTKTVLYNGIYGFDSNQQFQSYDSNNPHEIYGMNSGTELIGFLPKNLLHHHHHHPDSNSVEWKEFFVKSHIQDVEASSSKNINEGNDQFYHQDFSIGQDGSSYWHNDDRVMIDDDHPSLRCMFACEGNQRPSQGLSLSLGSSYPSRKGLQSFELRQPNNPRDLQHMMQDGVLGKSVQNLDHDQSVPQIRSFKYLAPAQELLNEFCSLGAKPTDLTHKLKHQKNINQLQEQENASLQSLYSLDHSELQKRKTKLVLMLEEVDRRYRHYCNQMKAVVSSFEAVAGNGAATVYSALASKAMSRHFRCLRDGIVDQLKATKKALGEKDSAAPGSTRGETPRLRILDQSLRQHRAFQQMSLMGSHPWRPQRGLPERAISVLRSWLFEHFLHPYPSDVDKHILARQTGLSRSQVSNWFINARVRLWKPMVEEMYTEEAKEEENIRLPVEAKAFDENESSKNQNSQENLEDQKPTHEQLVRIDSECLSSIINNPEKLDSNKSHQDDHHQHQVGNMSHQRNGYEKVSDSFGTIELDFSSYNHHNYAGGNGGGGENGGAGSVSLTLGLQQESQSSLFYSREHIDDCSPMQYSLMENDGQNLPYGNLIGAQLLHDLAR